MSRYEQLKKEKLKHISYSGAAFSEGWDSCAIEYEKLLDKLEDKIYHATRRVEELEYLIANKEDYDDMRADVMAHFLKINELQNKLDIAVKAIEYYTFEINNAYQAQNALNKIKDK